MTAEERLKQLRRDTPWLLVATFAGGAIGGLGLQPVSPPLEIGLALVFVVCGLKLLFSKEVKVDEATR